ncbi:LAMI_0E14906g1_1 [Lachancea mirantina]|uniref:Small ribosomal subunit protein mS38 n=1 Tax=Lachancea mirantina TaxID=1230905 RepID=A0A1G4JRY2_9SACH|nr:LAMI_0E14906g1_1 [Lachancea mirantina]
MFGVLRRSVGLGMISRSMASTRLYSLSHNTWSQPMVIPTVICALNPQIPALSAVQCSPSQADKADENGMLLDSVMRKRKLKMKKHKLRKRRKAQKAEKRKQSQGN